MKKILYFNNIYPLYRKPIWELLLDEKKYDFNIFYSNQDLNGIKSFNTPNAYKHYNKLHHLRNFFINGVLFWQSKVIKNVIMCDFDIVFFMGDMSVVSTWIGAIICRIRKKKVFFWGHGVYGNESFFKIIFRLLFLKLAHKNILYENRAKKILVNSGFDHKRIEVIYNSLNYDSQLKLFNKLEKNLKKSNIFDNEELPIIVFIGRLTKIKKIDFLIKSVGIINCNKQKVNLLIIGDGPQKKKLQLLSEQILNNSSYLFYGEAFDEKKIAELIYRSTICVSPGNIGLTAIHSLSYGTPIASHDNLRFQMPEVESIIEGENGFLFRKDDLEDLSNKILFWIKNNTKSRKEIRRIVDEKYNPYFQKQILDKLILNG